jgi:hypothetical protein
MTRMNARVKSNHHYNNIVTANRIDAPKVNPELPNIQDTNSITNEGTNAIFSYSNQANIKKIEIASSNMKRNLKS